VLAACIVSPGKFEAVLDLRRDGTFRFNYKGEIYLLALGKLAEMSSGQEQAFVETPCYNDETFEERPCTEEELAERRTAWEQQAESRRQDAEQMRQFLGGIDPADPAAAEELAARLSRQEGWKRVQYRGGGLFEVEFSLESRLDHHFAFPTLERFPVANSFVTANLRQGGSVQVEAPGVLRAKRQSVPKHDGRHGGPRHAGAERRLRHTAGPRDGRHVPHRHRRPHPRQQHRRGTGDPPERPGA
jgi:hypothetical protein